jgi:hypothetical protein
VHTTQLSPQRLDPGSFSNSDYKRSSTDIHFSVTQDSSAFEPQPPLSSNNTQVFNDSVYQYFSLSTLVDDNVFSLPLHRSPPPPTSNIPPTNVIGTISYQAGSDNYIFKCSIPRCKHKVSLGGTTSEGIMTAHTRMMGQHSGAM